MLKILFLKSNEIEDIVEKSFTKEYFCEMVFDEEHQEDQVAVKKDNTVQKLLLMNDIFLIINKELNVEILNYDVYEVGNFGDGFVFSIK